MSKIKTYITNSSFLNIKKTGEKTWTIHLSNGKKIMVEEKPEHNGEIWEWKIGNQVFGKDDYAYKYLLRIVSEKLTGKRIIHHAKREIPNTCGIEGRACRHPGECNTSLCIYCPIAEKFFADEDGVELIYAVGGTYE